MSIDAMKQALEAFEWNYNTDLDNIPACEQWAKMLKANITALRAAIEQAQEPVGYIHETGFFARNPNVSVTKGMKLYAEPPITAKYEFKTYAAYTDNGELKIGELP